MPVNSRAVTLLHLLHAALLNDSIDRGTGLQVFVSDLYTVDWRNMLGRYAVHQLPPKLQLIHRQNVMQHHVHMQRPLKSGFRLLWNALPQDAARADVIVWIMSGISTIIIHPDVLSALCSGYFAAVVRAWERPTGRQVAMKIMSRSVYREHMALLGKEVAVMHAMGSHPHLLPLQQVLYAEQRLYLVTGVLLSSLPLMMTRRWLPRPRDWRPARLKNGPLDWQTFTPLMPITVTAHVHSICGSSSLHVVARTCPIL